MRRCLTVLIATLVVAGVASPGNASPAAASGAASTLADFNGDGFSDLAVGVVGEDIGGATTAGAVNVLYGSATGVKSRRSQFWHQNKAGVAGDGAETDDNFGWALAAGDFNGDGFSDIAVGVPTESVGTVPGAGAVNVLYGSSQGLRAAGSQFWTQGSPGVAGNGIYNYDNFGTALAAGDFNGDGRSELAVGTPYDDIGGAAPNAGSVNVLFGSPAGLRAAGSQFWTQDSGGFPGGAENADQFGMALATGDFGKGSKVDLAIGVPVEDLGTIVDAGEVDVLYGSSSGLRAAGRQTWTQGVPGVKGDGAQAGDQFGSPLTAGRFGKSAQADLAVGIPREQVGTKYQAGAVSVLYGSSSGLTSVGSQFWHQAVSGVRGDGAQESDRFGSSLTAANFGKSSHADLAVGAGHESVGSKFDAGAVNVLYGTSTGLKAAGSQFWHQGVAGVAGAGAKANNQFGASLAAGSFGKGSRADLAVGVPGQTVQGLLGAGAINVLYGTSTGLKAAGSQLWHQGSTGVAGDGPEFADNFGLPLAAANR